MGQSPVTPVIEISDFSLDVRSDNCSDEHTSNITRTPDMLSDMSSYSEYKDAKNTVAIIVAPSESKIEHWK